jgi:hypothetical protein
MQRVLAGVAQSAEQPSCKRQVSGSNPLTGSQVKPSPSASMRARIDRVQTRCPAKASGWPVTRRSPSWLRRSRHARSPGAHACRCSSSARSGCGQASSSPSAARPLRVRHQALRWDVRALGRPPGTGVLYRYGQTIKVTHYRTHARPTVVSSLASMSWDRAYEKEGETGEAAPSGASDGVQHSPAASPNCGETAEEDRMITHGSVGPRALS